MQCSADAFEIAFQRAHFDMVHIAGLQGADAFLADAHILRELFLGEVPRFACLLELIHAHFLQHPILGLIDLGAGDAAVGHELFDGVAHFVSFPYWFSSHAT